MDNIISCGAKIARNKEHMQIVVQVEAGLLRLNLFTRKWQTMPIQYIHLRESMEGSLSMLKTGEEARHWEIS